MTTLEPPPPKTAPPRHKPILLIVDDEAGPRESLRFVFKDKFDCIIATCGRDGIEKAHATPPDIAVLDIRMPDMSGIDVLRELKDQDPHIECVLLTGYETLETARAAVHYGAAEYLNKPFDVFNIREVVDRCLTRRQDKIHADHSLRSLHQLNEDLSQAIADKSRTDTASVLSAGVVHELNNPLTIIAGYIQLLDRDLNKLNQGDTNATTNIQHRLATIQREIHRCKEIAERFLRFSRSPKRPTETINVLSLLEDTALLLRAHPAHAQARVLAHATEPGLTLRSCSVELMQTLINLGVNALQAMNGQGTLTFHAERADAPPNPIFRAPTFNPAAALVRLSVTDTGTGIPPENIEKIFTPYFTTKTTGNGLGLAVVAEIISKNNGAIEVLTSPGNGTTFNLYLPLAA